MHQSMALGEGGVTRRLLLGVETCVVLAAVAHSTHAWCHLLYFEERAGNCQAQGTCEEGGLQMGMAERYVQTQLGLQMAVKKGTDLT